MQEKDIREKLNQELDKMAPDILDKILATPIEPVKSEKELFGKNKPLFKQPKKINRYLWAPAMVAVAACIAILIMVMQPSILQPEKGTQTNIAFNIIIDVNPSISIDVKEDGTVDKISAGNKDAKKIVKQVKQSIQDDTDYNKAVKLLVKQLNENGYLKKKTNAMLVSVVSEDKKESKKKLKEIKEQTETVQKKNKIKCTTVYQVCDKSDKVIKVAEKNDVSIGKATLCMKIAEKEKASVKKMCKKTIDSLVKKVEKNGTAAMDDELFIEDIEFISEIESVSTEIESSSETETIEVITDMNVETTFNEEESATEERTTEVSETATSEPEAN
ncbi:MAG: hypothetical protein ACLRZ9_07425 [Eubacterium sp.]